MAQSVMNEALGMIRRAGRGYVFSPTELQRSGLGTRGAIDRALGRLTRAGTIQRVTNGIYHYPRQSRLVGDVPPAPEAIAQAMARATGEVLQPSEALAANQLGVSRQVPARHLYWTSGTPRTRRIGSVEIQFKRGAPKRLQGAGSAIGAVLQAIRYLGPKGAMAEARVLLNAIPVESRPRLRLLASLSPAWVADVVESMLEGAAGG